MPGADTRDRDPTTRQDAQFRADAEPIFSRLSLVSRPAIVVAVSGGSDSTALLLLSHAWFSTPRCATRLIVATVDHGLRADSAAEAAAVAALAGDLGLEHRRLRWEGAKPSSGIAAAARLARYRLLAEAAREAGTDLLLTGHTLDDQLETVAMRAERGPGRGLSGMAPATLFQGRTWIVRPLLEIRREALRAMLRRAGIGWIEDPSNRDPRYERARLRASGGGAPRHAGFAEAQRDRADLSRRAAGLVARYGQPSPAQAGFALDAALLDAPDGQAMRLALRALLAVAGEAEQLPAEAALSALLAELGAGPARATLSRCLVEHRGGTLRIVREGPRKGAGAASPTGGGPWSTFLPSFDLELARAVAALAGQPAPPDLPFGSHNEG